MDNEVDQGSANLPIIPKIIGGRLCANRQALQNMTVHINRLRREGHDRGLHEVFNTTEIRIHPQAGKDSIMDFDVALLVLDGESEKKPIIPRKSEMCFEDPAANCSFGKVLGWGVREEGVMNSTAFWLEEVMVPLWSREKCREAYGKDEHGNEIITDSMVCAGEEGKDACQRDSGGPLIIAGRLSGIVSWGQGCGQSHPGVYVNIAHIAPWIEEQLEEISGEGRTGGGRKKSRCIFQGNRFFPANCQRGR